MNKSAVLDLAFLLIQWSENDNCLVCKIWGGGGVGGGGGGGGQ